MRTRTFACWLAVTVTLAAGCFQLPRRMRRPAHEIANPVLTFAPNVHVHDLPNGMVIAIAPEPNTNVVTIDVRYAAGGADDPPGKEGLAHFVEHLAFAVRKAPDAPSITDRLIKSGLGYNAITTADITQYMSAGLAENLPALLDIERDRMVATCNQIDDAFIEREKDVVIQEIYERGGEHYALAAAIYGADHPYARNIGGTATTVRGFSREDVCGFLATNYGPTGTILVVSGGVGKSEVFEQVEAIFGGIEKNTRSERAPIPSARRHESEVGLDVERPAVLLVFPSSPFGTSAAILSRLAKTFLIARLNSDQPGPLHSAEVVSQQRSRAPVDIFWLTANNDDDASIKALVDSFFEAQSTIGDELFERAVRIMAREAQMAAVGEFEPLWKRPMAIADYLNFANERAFVVRDLELYQGTHPASIRQALSQYDRHRASIVVVRPKKAAQRESLRTLIDRSTRNHNIEPWNEPVDPADARRRLQVPPSDERTSPDEFVLASGLRVVMVPTLSYPLVDMRLIFPAGHRAVGASAAIPYLAAELIDTPPLDTYAFEDQTSARSALFMTNGLIHRQYRDHTAFHTWGGAVDVHKMLWRMQFTFVEGSYSGAQLQAWRKRAAAKKTSTDPVDIAIEREVFGGRFKARDAFARSAAAATVADLEDFKRKHYRMAGATLIVVGNFDRAAVVNEIVHLFGPLDSSTGKPAADRRATATAETAASPRADLAMADSDKVQLRVVLAYPIERSTREDEAALAVARTMIEMRANVVREKMGASYGVHVHFERDVDLPKLVIDTRISASAGPSAVHHLASAIDSLRNTSDSKATENSREQSGGDLTDFDADFVRARRRVFELALTTATDTESVGNALEAAVVRRVSIHHVREYVESVSTVTPERVRVVLFSLLDPASATRFVAGPKGTVEATFKKLNAGKVKWVE